MNTAKLIRVLMGFRGNAQLYEMNPPYEHHKYVVVSAADVPFSGPETYIFPADEKGTVVDWMEMDGSYHGGLSHQQALENAGYQLDN